MYKITEENYRYKFSKDNTPVLYCDCGDLVEFNTLDCFSNKLIPEGTSLEKDAPRNSNPCTGPLYIRSANPGDTLKVEIQKIELGEIGVTLLGPSEVNFENGLESFQIKRIPIVHGHAVLREDIKLPIKPMIGVIGVAPLKEVPTGLSGYYGGNMDCSQVKEGVSLYLPVFVEGGLLSIGDLHALMGEGEIGGNGLEINGKVLVKVSVLKNFKISGPHIESPDKWMTLATEDSLEKAGLEATSMMLDFLMNKGKYSREDANLLINLIGDLKICKLGSFGCTVRMEITKDLLSNFLKSKSIKI